MRIMIICSKHNYNKIPKVKKELEERGFSIELPMSYNNPFKEEEVKKIGLEAHIRWKGEMLFSQKIKVRSVDALLVLNFDKGAEKNYLGGSTFLEMYEAWMHNKKIFLYNQIPENILKDEIVGFNPTILNKDLNKIK